MADTLAFVTFNPPNMGPSKECSLCRIKSASFEYEINSDEPSFRELSGSCCLTCGYNLLSGLEEVRRARHEKNNSECQCGIN